MIPKPISTSFHYEDINSMSTDDTSATGAMMISIQCECGRRGMLSNILGMGGFGHNLVKNSNDGPTRLL